jgi:xanthine dehydrogenase YagR molybdenum-binding subunit
MGMGAATAQAQIAADALGVPFDAVRVEYGDSRLPAGPLAGQSTQSATIATSVLSACDEIKRKLGPSPAVPTLSAGVPPRRWPPLGCRPWRPQSAPTACAAGSLDRPE